MWYYCRLLVIVDTSSATIYIWGCLNGNISVGSNVATKSTFALRLMYVHVGRSIEMGTGIEGSVLQIAGFVSSLHDYRVVHLIQM
jgi:hypothetical protein